MRKHNEVSHRANAEMSRIGRTLSTQIIDYSGIATLLSRSFPIGQTTPPPMTVKCSPEVQKLLKLILHEMQPGTFQFFSRLSIVWLVQFSGLRIRYRWPDIEQPRCKHTSYRMLCLTVTVLRTSVILYYLYSYKCNVYFQTKFTSYFTVSPRCCIDHHFIAKKPKVGIIEKE